MTASDILDDLVEIEGGLELLQARKLIRETYWRLMGVHYTYDVDGTPTVDDPHPVRRNNLGTGMGIDSVKAAFVPRNPGAWIIDRAYRFKKFGIQELTGWTIDQFLELPPEAIEQWFEIAAEVKVREARDREAAEKKAKAVAERGHGGARG